MLNFTVGPVMSQEEILKVASKQTPYFRTPEFSEAMLENERLMLKFLHAPKNSRCVFLTTSGTGAMESVVMNVLNKKDKAIVINGGSFGQRFVNLCKLHGIDVVEVKCDFGKPLKKEQLDRIDVTGCTALLVNMHETSSGIVYDMNMLSDFCKANQLIFVVDAISAFIADPIDMTEWNIDVIITGSQKALALQPGISIIALGSLAQTRIENNEEVCMYLSLKEALRNMERGQTPFTPAVTILLQMNARLKQIDRNGGINAETEKIAKNAKYFRDQILNYGFEHVVEEGINRSNAVTALYVKNHKATYIFNELKDRYGIWICPSGGIYKDDVFRVGHIGDLSKKDYETLFDALVKVGI